MQPLPQHTERFVRQLQGFLMGGLMFDEAEGCAGATMGERLTAMGERMMRSCGDGRVDYLPPEDCCHCYCYKYYYISSKNTFSNITIYLF